jgi:hypothetical protein
MILGVRVGFKLGGIPTSLAYPIQRRQRRRFASGVSPTSGVVRRSVRE